MGNRKKIRRLRYLIHKYDIYGQFSNFNYLDEQIKNYSEYLTEKHCKERYDAYSELKNIISELNIDINTYNKIVKEESTKIYNSYSERQINNLKETRDNKGVYVGSGGSNKNSIRYPKKNRSKRVWKIFYEMFSRRAEHDEYDGTTSKRMK